LVISCVFISHIIKDLHSIVRVDFDTHTPMFNMWNIVDPRVCINFILYEAERIFFNYYEQMMPKQSRLRKHYY
jgi:hypothetical protein